MGGWGEPRGPHASTDSINLGSVDRDALPESVRIAVIDGYYGDGPRSRRHVWAMLAAVAALVVAGFAILVATARTARTAVELNAGGLAAFALVTGGTLALIVAAAAVVVVRRAIR